MATMRQPQVMPPIPGEDGDLSQMMAGYAPQAPPNPFGGGIDTYFNQGRVDQRVNSARDAIERFGKSRMASNRADLASRGTLGSGPEMTAMNRAEEAMGDRFANMVNDIYSNEGDRADQRELGMGRLQLDQDSLMNQLSQGQTSQLLQILQMLQGGAKQSAGGFI